MNKTYVKYVILLAICCFLAFTIGFAANKAYHKYKADKEYPQSSYTQKRSTTDLISLCDGYIRTNDLKYLDYVDELLSAEDYEQEVLEYYKDDTEFSSYMFLYGSKNTHLVSAIYICAVNNDIDKFISALEKYYPQMSSGIREICFNNTMMKLKNDFIKDNIDIIADKMHSLNFDNATPLHKIFNLSNVLAAYEADDKNNPKIKEIEKEIEAIYSEWNPTDKNAALKTQEEQMKNYTTCWNYMLKTSNSNDSRNTYSYAENDGRTVL